MVRSQKAKETPSRSSAEQWLAPDGIYLGDASELMEEIQPDSIACSVWSPPYHVGKNYERDATFEDWQTLLRQAIRAHKRVLIPGGFMVVNIADILAFPDPAMPRIQAPNISRQRSPVTREDVLAAKRKHPEYNRHQLGSYLNCSEQTVDRRLNGNNIRGGKYAKQTRVELVGRYLQDFCREAGLFLYDRRVWVKDPNWINNQWHSASYRSVNEFEDLYFFWKPGETVVDRNRLSRSEWAEWGSRQVWEFASVRVNKEHEAQFPVELPSRIIRLLTKEGDTILDPFMGSGTTAIAAIRTKRHFIGIDKMPEYCELARKRIAKEMVEPPRRHLEL